MALNDDKIKDLFSSKLSSFEPEVPASVWGGLDLLLSQPPVPTPDVSQATTAVKMSAIKTTLIATGVAASVALGIFIAYQPNEVVELPSVVEEVKGVVVDSVPTIILAESDFVPPAMPPAIPAVAKEEYKEPEIEVRETKSIEPEEVKRLKKTRKSVQFAEVKKPSPTPLKKIFSEDISLSLKTNMGAMASDVEGMGGELLFSKNERSTDLVNILKQENKDYVLSHKLPISVGITASKRLSRQFSLETGLIFTYLSSRVKSNSTINLKEEQTFGYLGIPIYLNYHFYDLSKANFYLSLGTMAQKDVHGKYTSKLIGVDGKLPLVGTLDPNFIVYSEPEFIKKSISQSNWQFSGHLTIGAYYPIYKRLNIYTTVGGAYYFDAGNEYRTIYSDRKFQVDLNLGLKFDF